MQTRIEGLDHVLRGMKILPEIMGHRYGPVYSGLMKAGRVIQQQAQANVRQITATPNRRGRDLSTGMLERSIWVMRTRLPQRYGGPTVYVTVHRNVRYPIDQRTPTGIGVATIGRMLEYGTRKRKPMEWMGPAFHAKKGEAENEILREVQKGVRDVEKKLGGRL